MPAHLSREGQAEVDTILRLHKAGLRVGGKQTPDGEEGYSLFHCWGDLGPVLGTAADVDAGISGMRDLLRDLYLRRPNSQVPKKPK